MCVSPLVCMRKRRFWTRIRGNLPVLVKPGKIVPQLVNQHGFTSPYDLNKHKTTESYAGLPLSEERLGGYTIRVCTDQGFAGGRPREHRNPMKSCMCP